ncbi:ORF6N domain-containing protein [Solitalea koreensis]|uniref:ORF6N domain-containing protein n=1 Tax=Solitalea koreensis TaxID=543615 RepID=A0A521D1Z3_9SPHI|nr:ORF6N domain-containing protein [Solitalea koreensis]SMO65733.1 ORF6N domain-containing protein [Solitalea koreensis]
MKQLVNEANIASQIYFFRGHKVMLDCEMASMYEVTTKRLLEQVQKNSFRFPDDFMFQLTENEYEEYLKLAPSQQRHGSLSELPYVFTEQGAVMLSSILNTRVAIETDIFVVRSFIKFRNSVDAKKKSSATAKTESKIETNNSVEKIELFFKVLLQVLESKKTTNTSKTPRSPIGFQIKKEEEKENKPKGE